MRGGKYNLETCLVPFPGSAAGAAALNNHVDYIYIQYIFIYFSMGHGLHSELLNNQRVTQV